MINRPTPLPISITQESGQASYSHDVVRELDHRCANELQMVLSLLKYSARSAGSPEVREALDDLAGRVAVVLHNRIGLQTASGNDLEAALSAVVRTLASLAEPLGISISLEVEGKAELHGKKTLAIALCVNELVTNAISTPS